MRDRPQRVVPDGCVDLVWLGESGLKIVGADTGPHTVAPMGASAAGIRLRPGAAGAVLGIPASEVETSRWTRLLLWGDAPWPPPS